MTSVSGDETWRPGLLGRREQGQIMTNVMSRDADQREALFNEGAIGAAYEVQVPVERVTRVRGILWDLDPGLLEPRNVLFPPGSGPGDFYAGIRDVLDRHPLARFAEVRASGTGLHVILWLKPEVELLCAADQERWAAIAKAVQATLPSDPDAPGLTALTRPIGAVNSKCGSKVELLRRGEPVSGPVVEEYMERLVKRPFHEVVSPLIPSGTMSPCPVCQGEGTRLTLGEYVGFCYGSCSRVKLEHFYEAIYRNEVAADEASDAVKSELVMSN